MSDLVAANATLWATATRHPFLDGICDGSLAPRSFHAWLVADRDFVEDLLRFQARLLAIAPRPDQRVLAGGLVALEDELTWFEGIAARFGLKTDAPPHPTVLEYREHLDSMLRTGYAAALTALWTLERAYLDAWTGARPGSGGYREFVEHWTAPGFAEYVLGLADAVARAGADDAAFAATARLEARFWEIGA